jgi:hypothetical protein
MNDAWVAQAVYVAVQLEVPDHLSTGPKTVEELAQLTGADQQRLAQVLRALAGYRVLATDAQGRYHNTRASRAHLCQNASWFRSYAIVWGHQLYAAGGAMLEMVQTGRTAFEIAHGQSIYEMYRCDAEQGRRFVEFMSQTTDWQHAAILEAFDFRPYRHVVDVGGGRAGLITAILRANSHLRGTILDQPHMRETASSRIEEAGLSERCAFVGGSFMEEIPAHGDLYVIKHVLHDWNDVDTERILACVADAMSSTATLVIIEGVMDERDGFGQIAKARDLEQMIWTSGAVRTKAEFEKLLHAAGLELDRIIHTRVVDASLLVARKAR